MSLLLDAPSAPQAEPGWGCQTPRILSTPHYRRARNGRWDGTEDAVALDFRSPAGELAIELAEDAGHRLDPWQQLALHHTLAEDAEGRWEAFEVVLNVCRQNGKGGYLEWRQLAGVLLFGEQLVIHTAHEFKTAAESFRRLDQILAGSNSLSRRVKRVWRSHGDEGFEFFNGARIRFLARTASSGRGFSGDLLIFDECMMLRSAPIGALLPVMSARFNPQIVYTGSAGIGAESEQLAALRARALAKDPDASLAYLEWSIDQHLRECPRDKQDRIVCDQHDDRDDERSFARANPALGIRIRAAHVAREMATMRADLFDTERLGVGDYPATEEETWSVIKQDVWEALANVRSRVQDPVAFAVETTPERDQTAICVAGLSDHQSMHVEVVDDRPGTGWVVERMVDLVAKWQPCALVVSPDGPAATLIAPLKKALEEAREEAETEGREVPPEVDFLEPTSRQLGEACTGFYDAVIEQHLVHLDQAPMTSALAGAVQRPLGDGLWAWSRRGSGVSVASLMAASLAAWGHRMRADEEEEGPPNLW
ncbi:terminase [Streptomyces scabiei]